MRIAHVLRRISFGDWGGTEQVVWNLAKAQRRAGHEVRVFATSALSLADSIVAAKIIKNDETQNNSLKQLFFLFSPLCIGFISISPLRRLMNRYFTQFW